MKAKRLLPFLLAVMLFTGCAGGTPEVSDVIEEPTGQGFNTTGRYLAVEVNTQSGEKQSAAVKATLELDEGDGKIEQEARSAARPQDRRVFDEFKEAFPDTEWVKCTIRIAPWNGGDFSDQDAILTCFAGVDKDFSPPVDTRHITAQFINPDPLNKAITDYTSYEYESADIGELFATMINYVEGETPYYEYVLYAVLPVERENYLFGFTSKDLRPFSREEDFEFPKEFPAEGYFCWEIPERAE